MPSEFAWTCPLCREEMDSIGPASLQLAITSHYRSKHPDVNALSEKLKAIPHTWTCQQEACPSPNVSRADEMMLDLAIIGHNRFYHERKEPTDGAASPQSVQAGFIRMHGRQEPYDSRFLAGLRIVW